MGAIILNLCRLRNKSLRRRTLGVAMCFCSAERQSVAVPHLLRPWIGCTRPLVVCLPFFAT